MVHKSSQFVDGIFFFFRGKQLSLSTIYGLGETVHTFSQTKTPYFLAHAFLQEAYTREYPSPPPPPPGMVSQTQLLRTNEFTKLVKL